MRENSKDLPRQCPHLDPETPKLDPDLKRPSRSSLFCLYVVMWRSAQIVHQRCNPCSGGESVRYSTRQVVKICKTSSGKDAPGITSSLLSPHLPSALLDILRRHPSFAQIAASGKSAVKHSLVIPQCQQAFAVWRALLCASLIVQQAMMPQGKRLSASHPLFTCPC